MSYIDTIELMRKEIIQDNWPLSYSQYPNDEKVDRRCPGFALGLVNIDNSFFVQHFSYKHKDNVERLKSLLQDLNLCPRRIQSESEKEPDEFVIVFYEYYYYTGMFPLHEFHFARIERDGTWVTKHGQQHPIKTSCDEISKHIFKHDGEWVTPTAYFAVRKPQ